MAITPKTPGTVAPPNDPAAQAEGTTAPPNSPTPEPVNPVNPPLNFSTQPAGTPTTPNDPTAQPAGSPAAPNDPTAQPVGQIPRVLTPLLNLDFVNGAYQLGVESKQLSELTQFSRFGTASFINRRLNNLNQYEYFIDYSVVDQLRFESNPNTKQDEGILLEGVTTNLALYSEEFDNVAWSKSEMNISPDIVSAPDLTSTADLIIPTTNNAAHFVSQSGIVILDGNDYSYSFFAKSGNYSFVQLVFGGSFGNSNVNVNINTGEVTASTPGLSEIKTKKLIDGWVWVSAKVVSSGTSGFIAISPINDGLDGRLPTYTGDGVNGVYVWGAQLEQQPAATSYIKTTSSAVTRARDDLTADNNVIGIGALNKTIVVYSALLESEPSVQSSIFRLGNSLRLFNNTNGLVRFQHKASGVSQTSTFPQNFTGGIYDGANQSIINDGIIQGVTTGEPLPEADLTGTIFIGQDTVNGSPLNGTISRITIYNIDLTSEEVAKL